MCSRYSQHLSQKQIQEGFDLHREPDAPTRYMVRPSNRSLVIREKDGERTADWLEWGFVAPWEDDPKRGKLINCRSETAAKKPTFRRAFRERRCIIPMSGHFEWTQDGKDRQPWYVTLKSGEPLATAGLWESWNDPAGGVVETFTLMMTDSNEFMAEFHERMMVILPRDQWSIWLDPTVNDPDEVQPLMVKSDSEIWQRWPVSPMINGNKFDGPEALIPIKFKRLFD